MTDEPAALLPDGAYDVFVIDASDVSDIDGDEAGAQAGAMRLELTVVAGEHKGEVITLTATGLPGSDLDLLGMPGTLTVTDGRPVVRIDQ